MPSKYTGCSLDIVFFLKMLWFFWTLQVLLKCWCLTCYCVHTLTPRETERGQSPEYILKSWKNTIFNEYPAYFKSLLFKVLLRSKLPLSSSALVHILCPSALNTPLFGLFKFNKFIHFISSSGLIVQFNYNLWKNACKIKQNGSYLHAFITTCFPLFFHRATCHLNGKENLQWKG